jgi:hypothetical protein
MMSAPINGSTVLGENAVRIAIKRGWVNHGLAGVTDLLTAKANGWIRKDRRCSRPVYRVTPKGRAAFREAKP